ncbi:hypothetical protein IFM89_023761 [Coptis chinensis]|uniref:F-box associated beta-propeller type 3 domain-containing protein n=1 Tax=Coptis chinensis TaxID=261450 RepID=A0A835H0R2_9MAGN|nr:hypothetical protein IFM89_023761 [Coptis chinensis]
MFRNKTPLQWEIIGRVCGGLHYYLIDENGITTDQKRYEDFSYCRLRYCNGLVCYDYFRSFSQLSIVNLSTKKRKDLPLQYGDDDHPPCFYGFEFGFDPSSKRFKVLGWLERPRIFKNKDWLEDYAISGFQVLTLEKGSVWRSVWNTPDIEYLRDAVTANGTLFWLEYDGREDAGDVIISFNLSNEEFRRTELPDNVLHRKCSHVVKHTIFELEGCLCLVEYLIYWQPEKYENSKLIGMWMMKDINNNVWVMMMKNITLPLQLANLLEPRSVFHFLARNGEILIAVSNGKEEDMLLYSFLNGQFKRIQISERLFLGLPSVTIKNHVENYVCLSNNKLNTTSTTTPPIAIPTTVSIDIPFEDGDGGDSPDNGDGGEGGGLLETGMGGDGGLLIFLGGGGGMGGGVAVGGGGEAEGGVVAGGEEVALGAGGDGGVVGASEALVDVNGISTHRRTFEFGFDPSSKTYKVLGWMDMDRDDDSHWSFQVLTLEKGSAWRPMSNEPLVDFLRSESVTANGTIFWLTRHEEIISFNLATEEFRKIEFPDNTLDWKGCYINHHTMFEFEGCLCLVEQLTCRHCWPVRENEREMWCDTDIIRVWMLKEVNKKDIALPLQGTNLFEFQSAFRFLARNGEILIAVSDHNIEYLFLFSFLSGQIERIQITGLGLRSVVIKNHKESFARLSELV